jgi:hypothetical protein
MLQRRSHTKENFGNLCKKDRNLDGGLEKVNI